MLFNSLVYALFLPCVFVLYWFLLGRHLRLQNLLLLVVSYVFYGWWDWRFLSLIFLSSLVDYAVGLGLATAGQRFVRRSLLILSLLVNLGLLGTFKYFNFFSESLAELLSHLGLHADTVTLNVVLPVGISFYTFQTLSYTIDVYRGRISPTADWVAFFAYVSFFPQLVAGPIERAEHLLPQFMRRREFGHAQATDGMRQILWGLFKKIVVADNCAYYVDRLFDTDASYSGSTLAVGVVLFAFQIYGDFSGYSDIAIGSARLFGFRLSRNFAFPYFSRDIAEFWRRWHISLSTWFRDYLYIPLGGSRVDLARQVRNVFIIFVVSGFWHGANWTFIVWGTLHAAYFLPLLLMGRNRTHLGTIAEGRLLPSFRDVLDVGATFGLVCLGWVFFRAESLGHAVGIITRIFSTELFAVPRYLPKALGSCIFVMLGLEWVNRKAEYGLDLRGWRVPAIIRWGLYYILVLIIFFFGNYTDQHEFIYFQF
jgi:D-alanyl-lipoteichoic acid acyltransferase DltB (MBOAT superfamily)